MMQLLQHALAPLFHVDSHREKYLSLIQTKLDENEQELFSGVIKKCLQIIDPHMTFSEADNMQSDSVSGLDDSLLH